MDCLPCWAVKEKGPLHGKRALCAHCNRYLRVSSLPYTCDPGQLPPALANKFVELSRDEDTDEFLRSCFAAQGLQATLKDIATGFLSRCFSLTDLNGMMDRGALFVFSTQQAKLLLGPHPPGPLLDIGAGYGGVTSRLEPLFGGPSNVAATERSFSMRKRLQQRGFVAGGEDLSALQEEAQRKGLNPSSVDSFFGSIALLNVLDRCDEPISLLRSLRDRLSVESGRLLLAVVLPFRPFVEDGPRRRRPCECLPLNPNDGWERAVGELWEKVLWPLGFDVEAVSRLPYLSHGDARIPVHALDDSIFVLKRSSRDDVYGN